MAREFNYFIDSHCHLTDERIFSQARQLIAEAREAHVFRFSLAGVESKEWLLQEELQNEFGVQVLTHFGLHPWWVEKFTDEKIAQELQALEQNLVRANGLGETGLDHAPKRDPSRFPAQEKSFQTQIDLALQFRKPLILHIVHAHEAALKILRDRKANQVPLIVHSYSGNPTLLQEYLKLGAYISFNGNVNQEQGYESAKKSLVRTPVDRLLFETDSPDQGPVRGDLNHPASVVNTYETASKLLQIPIEELKKKIAENFSRVYYAQQIT